VLGLGLYAAAPALATASGTSATTTKVTVVTVTLGKPSELALKLSKVSLLSPGPITFKVKNAGGVAHSFGICAGTVTSSTKNACTAKKTAVLKPGQSAALTIVLAKKGTYEYLSTVPGQAAAGMKGLLGVGVKLAVPVVTPSPGGSTTTPTTTTTSISNCAKPQASTVEVNLFEYAISLSSMTVPCGPVTFNVHNTGKQGFDFAIRGSANRQSPVLDPGQSTSISVSLAPGSYSYLCVVCAESFNMEGNLTVSG
jgi:uncharacterized cupredoxin-like copper-binding protein